MGVGSTVGLALTGIISDRLTKSIIANNGVLMPEYRLPPLVIGAFSIPSTHRPVLVWLDNMPV